MGILVCFIYLLMSVTIKDFCTDNSFDIHVYCAVPSINYSCFYISSEILFELGFPVFVLIEHV